MRWMRCGNMARHSGLSSRCDHAVTSIRSDFCAAMRGAWCRSVGVGYNPRLEYPVDYDPRLEYPVDYNPRLEYPVDYNPRLEYPVDYRGAWMRPSTVHAILHHGLGPRFTTLQCMTC